MNVKRAINNQKGIYDMLKTSIDQNRMSHAYLFYGEEGTGKKELAYALACMLYCKHGGCLECETCKSILEGNHMNVDYIGIQDKKTMISKEQITDLQEEFSKTSLVEGTRIYIVDGIDTASSAAQNSLLKFIEEPVNATPTVGIFLATELSNVVNTIQSRCILEHFPTIAKDKEIEMLTADGVDALDAILSSILTNNPEEAYEIVSSSDFIAIKELFLEFLHLRDQKAAVLFYAKYQTVFSEYTHLEMLLNWILAFLEDCLFYKDAPLLDPLQQEEKQWIHKGEEKLKANLEWVLELFRQLKCNVLAKNVFHELILKLI